MTDAELSAIVDEAVPHSDRGLAGLTDFAGAFVASHGAAPGGLSIEVGTRCGGSALMFCRLLENLYPNPLQRPMVWSVDPYGSKPYIQGGTVPPAPVYSDPHYLIMRQLMAPIAHHAHWLMPSNEFFTRLGGMMYWRPGDRETYELMLPGGARYQAPVGERKLVKDITFVLLDGDHDLQSIMDDVLALTETRRDLDFQRLLAPLGVIAIDNTDSDPDTVPWLKSKFLPEAIQFGPKDAWAVLQGAGIK